jgi:hypothetical protein
MGVTISLQTCLVQGIHETIPIIQIPPQKYRIHLIYFPIVEEEYGNVWSCR